MDILITVAIILICIIAFYIFCIKTSKMQDEKTGRCYEYVKDTENPHHAPCKNCDERARLIYTTQGKKYYGTECMFCHRIIWFDLRKNKEDL